MNQGRTVFSQLMGFLPDREFRRCVERYRGDFRLRGFSCWDQYLAMAFAQLTYRESLRDIETCLGAWYVPSAKCSFLCLTQYSFPYQWQLRSILPVVGHRRCHPTGSLIL